MLCYFSNHKGGAMILYFLYDVEALLHTLTEEATA